MTKKLDMGKVTKRYNDLMNYLTLEHRSIGCYLSENTDGWNLRDMVAECDYQLSTYYEWGHNNYELRYSEFPEERKTWRCDTGRLKRFIARYEPYIWDMECHAGHCSKYD